MFSGKYKFLAIFCAILFIFSCFLAYADNIVRPILYAEAEAYIQTLLTEAVAVSLGKEELSEHFTNAISFDRRSDGSVSAYTSNMLSVNRIRSFLMTDMISGIKASDSVNFDVSLGSLTGAAWLYGRGPVINFKLTPLFAITCDISSEFSDAGINQTLHSLKLNIGAKSRIKEPLADDVIMAKTSALISETVIVGDIPDAYTVIIRAEEGIEDDINDYAASVD